MGKQTLLMNLAKVEKLFSLNQSLSLDELKSRIADTNLGFDFNNSMNNIDSERGVPSERRLYFFQ